MSKPWTSWRASWRSLYRALIRECSYLPDPVANKQMHGYVQLSFRAYASTSAQKSLSLQRMKSLRRRANKFLSLFKRANEGYVKSLERVLLLSYGRVGRRKHLLLEPLLRLENHGVETKRFTADWEPPGALMELAKSQEAQPAIFELGIQPHNTRLKLRLYIPATNVWGRPTPIRRQVNMRRAWYTELVNGVLPPLPDEDWNILQKLALGKLSWSPPKRRKSPQLEYQEPDRRGLDAAFLAYGPRKGFTYATSYKRDRPHQMKLRLMRHIWQRLTIITPRMVWDTKRSTWKFDWGLAQPPPPIYQQITPAAGLALFKGVNQKTGEVLKS